MPISLKATVFALVISLALFLSPEKGIGARSDTKIVVRIETATAQLKGRSLIVHASGMARTPASVTGGGELLRRNQKQQPNEEGLLEYELHFNPPANYSGDKLKRVKASLKESSVPAGVKGVRVYAQYNEMNAMLPAPTKEKPAPKKKEPAPKKEEPAPKKEQPVAQKKEPAVSTQKPALTAEKPALKKEEAKPKQEEKKRREWNFNPFRRKPAPASQVSATPPQSKKPGPTPVKEQPTPAPRRKEPVSTAEKPVLKKAEAAPKQEERKRRGWNLNPFRRKATPTPPGTTMPPESKKPGPTPTKEQPEKKEPALTAEKPALKKEEAKPKQEEKKSRGWNWNPFRRKAAPASQMTPPPPPSKKPEPTPVKEETTSKKKEATPKAEKPVPKKEEAEKKEETKKKSRWRALNPLNWNPFYRKSDTSSQDSGGGTR